MKNKRGLRTKTVVYMEENFTFYHCFNLYRNSLKNLSDIGECFTCRRQLEDKDQETSFSNPFLSNELLEAALCQVCGLRKNVMFCRGYFENDGWYNYYHGLPQSDWVRLDDIN